MNNKIIEKEMLEKVKEAEKNNITPVIVYSDEDKCNETATHFYEPHFKMDFNLDLHSGNSGACSFSIAASRSDWLLIIARMRIK